MTQQIDGQELRQVMRNIPSPVAILTFAGENGPRGVTIGSFTSLSLEPPLVSFNLMKGRTSEDFLKGQYFGIHVLRNDQGALSDHFALPDLSSSDQFRDTDFKETPEGVPGFTDCKAVLICSIYDAISAGDHSLILGRVLRANLLSSAGPLLYFQRSYHEIKSAKMAESESESI